MVGGTQAMSVEANADGINYLRVENLTTSTTNDPPNLYVNSIGMLKKTSASLYSAEEVDKKLAVKDKLIEKLSARLDELEKRVK